MKHLDIAVFFAALFTATVGASPAAACFDSCVLPSVIVGEQVPVNTPGFHVDTASGFDAPEYSLKRVDPDLEAVIPLKRAGDTLIPEIPLVLGAHYVLRTVDVCDGVEDSMEQPFVAVEANAPPIELGTLDAGGASILALANTDEAGYCREENVSTLDMTVWPSPDSYAWSSVMVFETIVDGEPWHPAVTPQWTLDRDQYVLRSHLYASCPEQPDFVVADGIEPGLHLVAVRARIPHSRIVVETEAVEVDLFCTCPDGLTWDAPTNGCIPYPSGYDIRDCTGGDHEGCPIDYIDEPGISCSATSAPLPGLSGLFAAVALLWLRRRSHG